MFQVDSINSYLHVLRPLCALREPLVHGEDWVVGEEDEQDLAIRFGQLIHDFHQFPECNVASDSG
jgi:hypothetical protein